MDGVVFVGVVVVDVFVGVDVALFGIPIELTKIGVDAVVGGIDFVGVFCITTMSLPLCCCLITV